MSDSFIRWRCPACGNLHTRRITPHPDDRHIILTQKTFPREDVDYTTTRLIDRPGDTAYILPTPIDLTCDAGDALIPDEERLP